MQLHLPNSAFLGNIDPFLRSFQTDSPETLQITANKKWISVHPVVLSMIAARGRMSSKITIEPLEAKSKHYLERMGLFSMFNLDSTIRITEHESTGRFIPLTVINTSAELTRFITEMVPLLHVTSKHSKTIGYIISELIRNVLEHARSTSGAVVCAQYYKKSKKISIGIADTGIGIRASIAQSHFASNDLGAIRLALTPGITGTTGKEGGTEFNAGAGLFFIKSIAKVNRDFFVIYSGAALYKLLKTPASTSNVKLFGDPFQDKHTEDNALPYWQGTVVGIDLSLESTEEFTTLLDMIHTTYISTVQERKKTRHRKLRFE